MNLWISQETYELKKNYNLLQHIGFYWWTICKSNRMSVGDQWSGRSVKKKTRANEEDTSGGASRRATSAYVRWNVLGTWVTWKTSRVRIVLHSPRHSLSSAVLVFGDFRIPNADVESVWWHPSVFLEHSSVPFTISFPAALPSSVWPLYVFACVCVIPHAHSVRGSVYRSFVLTSLISVRRRRAALFIPSQKVIAESWCPWYLMFTNV